MMSIDYLIGLLIDGGVFYGVNEIIRKAGLSQAKPDMSDVTIYVLMDALVKKGYLINPDIMAKINASVSAQPGPDNTRTRDMYVALLAAAGMIAYDSVQKGSLKIVPGLIKAFAGQLGNIFVDEAFALNRID